MDERMDEDKIINAPFIPHIALEVRNVINL